MAPRPKRPEPRINQAVFRRELLRWFARKGRTLPWRKTRDPYAVLVSEVMLQQTQVATVIPYYKEWLRRFPTLRRLARAPEGDVLHAWQGLGYYSRARNLHAAAREILKRRGGRFPKSIDRIRELPGIGKYTANAVATFAFDQSVPIVEANTARVLARIFDIRLPVDQATGRATLWERAASLVPRTSAREFNSALIDLGAMICLPRPKCQICPVKRFCRASDPGILPRKKKRPSLKNLTENHFFARHRNKILLEKSAARWREMWILPMLRTKSATQQPVYESHFPFTHHRIKLVLFRKNRLRIARANQRWFPVRAIGSIPIPSPHRRAIEALL